MSLALLAAANAQGEVRTWQLPQDLHLEMVWLDPGTFTMGAVPEDPDQIPDETPRHEVTLTDGFWMGTCEVTQEQFASLMGYNPSHFQNGVANLPVEQVSWNMAMVFCQRLTTWAAEHNQLPEGYHFSLPTEAQWEYACSPTGNEGEPVDQKSIGQFAWHRNNAGYCSNPVGTKKANSRGLHDMLGNVWEWCIDWKDRYPDHPVTDPRGPEKGVFKSIRGSCFLLDESFCRSSNRGCAQEDARWQNIGFRVALVKGP